MNYDSEFYMVKKKALPEVLLKVVNVNRLLSSGRAKTIQEAITIEGISRSSYYKYKDDIYPIRDKMEGRTITFTMEMEDSPGCLSDILHVVADCKANVLTIHQSIPVNGVALVTLSVLFLPVTDDVTKLYNLMKQARGIHDLKIVSAE